MSIESGNESPSPAPKENKLNELRERRERERLIVHLGKTFTRRYDLQVIPSHEKDLWACSIDPKVLPNVSDYIDGNRETLDDLPLDLFEPKQILYDESSIMEMDMEHILSILHHEAGHAKFSDFKLMFEGQRYAVDEGHLPTSFWLMFEGIEDPRINNLEGMDSPAIDRQIRKSMNRSLQERLTEMPIRDRSQLWQFAFNSYYHWLNGEPIPELVGTEVGAVYDKVRPLLDLYLKNTDREERKTLQTQIWNSAKALEQKDIEKAMEQQIVQQKKEGSSGNGDHTQQQESQSAEDKKTEGIMKRLKKAMRGNKKKDGFQEEAKPRPERFDLSKLTDDELEEVKSEIEQMSPEEKKELEKKAREVIDEIQKQEIEEEMSKTMKFEKNEQTGDYQAIPQLSSTKEQAKSKKNFDELQEKVEREEAEENAEQVARRQQQEASWRQQTTERRQKLEMEKAGFDTSNIESFQLYQSLEDSMVGQVRRFIQAISTILPRRKEGVYEGGYFSGSRIDRRELIRRVPLDDERFHMRQVERPTGDPRLYVGLLVDNSISMDGKKIEVARKTMIFYAKVFRELGIPFMMGSFGSNPNMVKQFKEDFDDPQHQIKPKLIEATNANDGGTNMYTGLELVIGAMRNQRRYMSDSHGLIFVISDGDANEGLVGDSLRDYVYNSKGRLTFKAFGLSASDAELENMQVVLGNYFGEANCAFPKTFEDLPDEAFRILRTTLMKFQNYLQ